MAEVVTYQPRWREAFARLNREWIETYFTLEAADLDVFADPEAAILAPGGQIFFVIEDGQVLGTCAVVPHAPGVYEIAKMAVVSAARGRGYGDLLMKACVAFASAAGARRIVILSNTKLAPAIRLYQKHGFVRVPVERDQPYARADIQLERELGTSGG